MGKLLDAAIAIANWCEVDDVHNCHLPRETYAVPVKLLNALREAAKESPYYKDPAKERRDREAIERDSWTRNPDRMGGH